MKTKYLIRLPLPQIVCSVCYCSCVWRRTETEPEEDAVLVCTACGKVFQRKDDEVTP